MLSKWGDASRNRNDLACDMARVVSQQERDCRSNLFGFAETTNWDLWHGVDEAFFVSNPSNECGRFDNAYMTGQDEHARVEIGGL